jgi:hypothetical protein
MSRILCCLSSLGLLGSQGFRPIDRRPDPSIVLCVLPCEATPHIKWTQRQSPRFAPSIEASGARRRASPADRLSHSPGNALVPSCPRFGGPMCGRGHRSAPRSGRKNRLRLTDTSPDLAHRGAEPVPAGGRARARGGAIRASRAAGHGGWRIWDPTIISSRRMGTCADNRAHRHSRSQIRQSGRVTLTWPMTCWFGGDDHQQIRKIQTECDMRGHQNEKTRLVDRLRHATERRNAHRIGQQVRPFLGTRQFGVTTRSANSCRERDISGAWG